MKVLFIEPCYIGFGGYFRAINICSHLSKKGVKVDLLVASQKKFSFSVKKTRLNGNLTQYELPRFDIHFFINGRIFRALIALFFGAFFKYDIIHACVPVQLESNIPAFFLKLFGKNVVMDWDDYWEASTIYGEYRFMKKYVAFCEQRAPAFFENMVVVSDLLKRLALERGAKKVLKLVNGINTEQFVPHEKQESRKKLNLENNGKYLLAFGNTYINDRAYLLFKAFEEIYNLDPSVRLLFNNDPYKFVREERLEGRINPDCLKNIINTGYIQQENLGFFLGACDAAIFIVGDSDNERANFPIRIGSYLNGEAIVIMNDVNSEAGNVLKEYQCAIIEKDLSHLAAQTVVLLNDSGKRNQMKNRVAEAKQALSWSNIIRDLPVFYQSILNVRATRK